MIKSRALTVIAGLCGILAYTAGPIGVAQVVAGQAVDANGAPQYRVDPFWPKPLPNHWILGSAIGVWVDERDHVWIIHRSSATLANQEKGSTHQLLDCLKDKGFLENC